MIIFNSDDMKDSAVEFATDHPEIFVIHPSAIIPGRWNGL